MRYTSHEERIKVLGAFYQLFLFEENHEEYDQIKVLCSQYDVDDIHDVPLLSRGIYLNGLLHYDEIIEKINSHLVRWTFDRLDNVAKAILMMGVSEGNYLRDTTPRSVVINECVEIAKEYLKVNDHRFVNAVLDKAIVKDA